MKSMMILCCGIVFFSVFARAGGLSDGGGNAVVCKDPKGAVKSTELLDFYEGRNLYNFKIPDLGKKDPLAMALEAAHRIDKGGAGEDPSFMFTAEQNGLGLPSMQLSWAPELEDSVEGYVRYVFNNMQILAPGVALKPIDDSHNIIVPENCEISQLADYRDSTDMIYVVGDIWNRLSNTNKAALLVHEALYKKLRILGENTSERARVAVGAAFAGDTLVPLMQGVPQDPVVCWSEKDTDYRFAVYDNGSNEAVFQFFHLNGKVPLTKTSIKTPIAESPLAKNFNESLSSVSNVSDSVLDHDLKIHWSLTKDDQDHFVMTMGEQNAAEPITCQPYNQSSSDPSGSVDFKVSYLIPASTQSCFERTMPPGSPLNFDIAPWSMSLGDLSIKWSNPSADLYVDEIVIHFEMPGRGPYFATITGDELASLNGTHGQWGGLIPRSGKGQDSIFKSSCGLNFGGINPPQAGFSAPGTIEIIGFSRDDNGQETPVKIEKAFKVMHL